MYQQFVYLKESWQGFIDRAQDSGVSSANIMKCYLFIGPGMIAYIIGAVLYFISIAYNFVLDTLNEDDEIERIVRQNKELAKEKELEEKAEEKIEAEIQKVDG